MKKVLSIICISILMLLSAACSDNKDYETAICALTDISGTYADEKENIVKVIKAGIVPKLLPGDHLFLIAIDSNSYSQDNLIGKVTMDYRPSQANQQKLAIATVLDDFSKETARSRFTDISGAMMLCGDYLKKTMAGTEIIFIFSDMQEELQTGVKRDFSAAEFENVDIAAMNVIKLAKDSSNPKIYRNRLAKWEKRVMAAGAKGWNISIEPSDIPDYIDGVRK